MFEVVARRGNPVERHRRFRRRVARHDDFPRHERHRAVDIGACGTCCQKTNGEGREPDPLDAHTTYSSQCVAGIIYLAGRTLAWFRKLHGRPDSTSDLLRAEGGGMKYLFAIFFCATAAFAQPELTLVPIAIGLNQPVGVVSAGDSRLFIVEKTGQIMIHDGARVLPSPFLDIHSALSPDSGSDGEHGLLGLAFNPANPRFFYVDYTNFIGDITIERFETSADPNFADANSATLVLRIPHPFADRHNGGQLQFGPDGYLYISVGDGGVTGDPNGNAQNPNVL